MTILVADDDPLIRSMLAFVLRSEGFEIIEAGNGPEALQHLQEPDAPRLALIDRMMPDMDGVDVVRAVRAFPTDIPPYLILLTSRNTKEEVVEGLDAGANDYIQKPFNSGELLARVRSGKRMLQLQEALAEKVRQLEAALKEIQTLHGIIPICARCKNIRDDAGYWKQVEVYISEHTSAEFTHGLCPGCAKVLFPESLVPGRALDG